MAANMINVEQLQKFQENCNFFIKYMYDMIENSVYVLCESFYIYRQVKICYICQKRFTNFQKSKSTPDTIVRIAVPCKGDSAYRTLYENWLQEI